MNAEQLIQELKRRHKLLEDIFDDVGKGEAGDANISTNDTSKEQDTSDLSDFDEPQGQEQQVESVDIKDAFQLKVIFGHLSYMVKLSYKLLTYSKEFEDIYESYARLYRYFKDFVMNFEEFDDDKKKHLFQLFREALSLSYKALKQKIS